MTPEELKQQAHKEFDELCKKGNRLSFLARGAKDEIKSFIDSLIDKTTQISEERIVGIIEKLDTVDIKDQSGKIVKEQLISKNSLLHLITNKSDINK